MENPEFILGEVFDILEHVSHDDATQAELLAAVREALDVIEDAEDGDEEEEYEEEEDEDEDEETGGGEREDEREQEHEAVWR